MNLKAGGDHYLVQEKLKRGREVRRRRWGANKIPRRIHIKPGGATEKISTAGTKGKKKGRIEIHYLGVWEKKYRRPLLSG